MNQPIQRANKMRDEQEALSRKYSNDLILLLPLSSGNIAVFNTARELCEITTMSEAMKNYIQSFWYPPKTVSDLVNAAADTIADMTNADEMLRKAGLL